MTVTIRHLLPMFLWATALLVFLFFFGPWKLCLLGLLAAACVAAVLRPLLIRLPGPRAIRGLLLGLVPLLLCAGLLFVAVWMLVGAIERQFQSLPEIVHHFDAWLAAASHRLGLGQPLTLTSLLSKSANLFGGNIGGGFGRNLIDLAIGTIFVFIGTIYLLAEPSEQVIPPLLRLLPLRRQIQARAALNVLEPRLRWWLIGALITSIIIGLTSLAGSGSSG